MTQMLAPQAVPSGNYTVKHKRLSDFYFLDELYGNELVFVLSFVS